MLEDDLKRRGRELQERILHSSEVVYFTWDLPPVIGSRKLERNLFCRSNALHTTYIKVAASRTMGWIAASRIRKKLEDCYRISNLKICSNGVCSLGFLSGFFCWGFSSSKAGMFLLAEEIEFTIKQYELEIIE